MFREITSYRLFFNVILVLSRYIITLQRTRTFFFFVSISVYTTTTLVYYYDLAKTVFLLLLSLFLILLMRLVNKYHIRIYVSVENAVPLLSMPIYYIIRIIVVTEGLPIDC